ncbi:perlucin [Biomphalaria glabrata]
MKDYLMFREQSVCKTVSETPEVYATTMGLRKVFAIALAINVLQFCQAAHVLTATPTAVGVGLTRQLEVKCTFSRDSGSIINSLLSLHIAHSANVDNPSFSLLASINSNDNKVTGVILNTGAKVSGGINNNGESFLKITWSYPLKRNGGRYRCRANGANSVGKVVDSIKGTIVTADVPNINSIVQELINVNKRIDDQESGGSGSLSGRLNVSGALRTQFVISEPYKGRRYYLSFRPYLHTVQDAHFRCQMYGGYLTEIDDSDEFEFVRNFLKNQKERNYFEIFIGANDEENEGRWVYPYSNRTAPYLYFRTGQPDGGRGANNLCFWRDGDFYMSDCILYPNQDWGFLCEIPN